MAESFDSILSALNSHPTTERETAKVRLRIKERGKKDWREVTLDLSDFVRLPTRGELVDFENEVYRVKLVIHATGLTDPEVEIFAVKTDRSRAIEDVS